MVCRCSSPQEHADREMAREHERTRYEQDRKDREIAALKKEVGALQVDNTRFEIIDAHEVGLHLVLQVRYPSCKNCSYEGVKVLIYLNTKPIDALRWRVIDPHFRDPKIPRQPHEAPSPFARFPASKEGVRAALEYVRHLNLAHHRQVDDTEVREVR